MPYTTWVDGHVLSAVDMTAVTSDPASADVATSQTTTSATYTDLATAGPSVSLTLTVGQAVLLLYYANASTSATTAGARMSYAVSGASTVAAADTDAAITANTDGHTVCMAAVYVAAVAGSHTFTSKYRAGGGPTGTWSSRRIVARKF